MPIGVREAPLMLRQHPCGHLRAVSVMIWLLVLASCSISREPPEPHAVGIQAQGCGPGLQKGSGFLVAPNVVLTSAHVIAGAETITVLTADKRETEAAVVGFDPDMDLAYLHTAPDLGPLPTMPDIGSDDVEAGATGRALVFRDGASTELDVVVRRRVRINTEDIYVQGDVTRPGFELTADIEPGDSGGVVFVEGKVVGVLWARSRRGGHRAYAIDVERGGELIEQQLASGDLGPQADPSRCD